MTCLAAKMMLCFVQQNFRGIFAWLPRSIAGYVTKQPGEYDRKDTQDGRVKDSFYKIKTASKIRFVGLLVCVAFTNVLLAAIYATFLCHFSPAPLLVSCMIPHGWHGSRQIKSAMALRMAKKVAIFALAKTVFSHGTKPQTGARANNVVSGIELLPAKVGAAWAGKAEKQTQEEPYKRKERKQNGREQEQC